MRPPIQDLDVNIFSFAMSLDVPISSNNYVVAKAYKTIFTEYYVLGD